MVILAFPDGSPVTYDSNDEGITEIIIEDGKIRIGFMDNGRNWAREIPVSSLKFFEYPKDTVEYSTR